MITSKKIELSRSQLFWHYSVIPLLLIVPLITSWHLIELYKGTYSGVRTQAEIMEGYLFIIPAILFYFIQRRRLNFREYKIKISDEAFKFALEKTALELNWRIEDNTDNYIRAHRSWNWANSWGEMITITKNEDTLLINSICDPDGIFASVISYGWNKKNIKTFIRNVSVN